MLRGWIINEKSRYIFNIVWFVLLGISTGCSHSPSKTEANNVNDLKSAPMLMSNEQSMKAFNEEISAFIIIEQELKKNDFKDVSQVAVNLHEIFHSAIFPALKDKKGVNFAEDIHVKYDECELQDAISNKDIKKVDELIKVNRDNLNNVANILGTPINK